MKIISDFKDYYDSAIGFGGIDNSIIYNRKTIEINDESYMEPFIIDKLSKFRYWSKFGIKPNFDDFNYYSINIIGFCGKFYLCLKIKYLDGTESVIWNEDKISELLIDDSWKKKPTNKNIKSLLDKIKNYNNLEIFRKYNSPYFVLESTRVSWNYRRIIPDSDKLIVNPNLNNYKFQNKFEPYSAFQEIEMFISGVLGTSENKIIEIEDKYKIQSHGFDQWSFKNPNPPKRKQK